MHRVEVIADRSRMRHGIDQCELVGQLGQFRVHFIDAHAWHFSVDRHVWPAVFQRRLWFHIPGIQVAGSATQQDEDAGLFRRDCFTGGVDLVAPQHHARHAETQCSQATCNQGLPAVHLEFVHPQPRFDSHKLELMCGLYHFHQRYKRKSRGNSACQSLSSCEAENRLQARILYNRLNKSGILQFQ